VSYNDQVAIDVASEDGRSLRGVGGSGGDSSGTVGDSPDLNAIWNELMSMKTVVEDEHDRKLRRIESDLRWTMTLVGGQFLTIIGSAIAMLAGE
jgi:hypothetical protein